MRLKNLKNILDKTFTTLPLEGEWEQLLGVPEANGLWLIYGVEKMGKTTLSLLLAAELTKLKKVLYVMAEQGFDKDFQDTLKRLSIPIKSQLLFEEYVPIETMSRELKKKNKPDIIFIDNITVYVDELKNGALRRLQLEHQNKLFIMLAHEENGEPYTATAKLAKKLAKRIIHVEGNRATSDGRGPGGSIIINHDKAALYHGTP